MTFTFDNTVKGNLTVVILVAVLATVSFFSWKSYIRGPLRREKNRQFVVQRLTWPEPTAFLGNDVYEDTVTI